MSSSQITDHCPSRLKTALMFAALLFSSGQLYATDGVITISESTFNKFADAIGTLNYSDRYKVKVGGITVCNAKYTASLTDLEFDIKTTGVDVEGEVSAEWCGFNFGSDGPELDATGNIYYDPTINSVRFSFNSASVKVKIHVDVWFWEGDVTVTTIDVTDMLNDIPPVPVRRTLLSFDAAGGTEYIFMDPLNVSLQKKNGSIELHSDVLLH